MNVVSIANGYNILQRKAETNFYHYKISLNSENFGKTYRLARDFAEK